MKKQHFFIFIVLFLFSGFLVAGLPKLAKRGFTYCFDNNDTGIEKLIDIDGYYESYSLIRRNNKIDTTFNTMMFYSNGLYVGAFGDTNRDRIIYDQEKSRWLGGNIPLFFEEISKDKDNKKYESFYLITWGRYIINNDTIKIQHMQKPSALASNPAYESWYKVTGRNSLIWIKTFRIDKEYPLRAIDPPEKNITYYFHKVPIIPPFDNAWILKEKWFWCNENDWKIFKKNKIMPQVVND